MPSVGPNIAGTGTATAPPGAGGSWSNPGYITADDNQYAQVTHTVGTVSGRLIASNFGFTLNSASISGIVVTFGAARFNGLVMPDQPLNVQLRNAAGIAIGNTFVANVGVDDGVAQKRTYTIGNTSNMWGTSLTPTDINDSDFGVEFWTDGGDRSFIIGIDWVEITIYYPDGQIVTGSASIQGTATPVIAGTVGKVGSAALQGTATSTIAGTVGKVGVGALVALASTIITGSVQVNASSTVTAEATITAQGVKTPVGEAALSAEALAASTAKVEANGEGSLTADAQIVSIGVIAITGDSALVAEAIATPAARVNQNASTSVSATATVVASALRIAGGRVTRVANANFTRRIATVAANASTTVSANSTVISQSSVVITGAASESATASVVSEANAVFSANANISAVASSIASGNIEGFRDGSADLYQDANNTETQGETCEPGIVVLRSLTVNATGTFQCRHDTYTRQGLQPLDPVPPQQQITSSGSISVPFMAINWTSYSEGFPEPGTIYSEPITYYVGCRATMATPFGSRTVTNMDTFVLLPPPSGGYVDQQTNVTKGGTWQAQMDLELIAVPNEGGSTGTGNNFRADPPHASNIRFALRTKLGGNYTFSVSVGGTSDSVTGKFQTKTELSVPDSISLAAQIQGSLNWNYPTNSAQVYSRGSWRDFDMATSITASGAHGEATASTANGATASIYLTSGVADMAFAASQMNCAVAFTYELNAKRMAMESNYPTSEPDHYFRHNTLVTTPAFTDSFSDTRTCRSEFAVVEVRGNNSVLEAKQTHSIPNQFGPIYMAEIGNGEMDRYYLVKDRSMSALTVTAPEYTDNLTGTDTALTSNPYGVQRSYTSNTPNYQGLMGYRYLEIVFTEAGGNSAGAALTVVIERDGAASDPEAESPPPQKSWSKDYQGNAITTPGGGNSKTILIDLCSPDVNDPSGEDATDTTYPYLQDWQTKGGDEDNKPRVGEGQFTGVLYASRIKLQGSSNRTLTYTTIKAKRLDPTLKVSNLPVHEEWVKQRPDSIVSGVGTTTEWKVRQCFMVDHDGRLLTAEWSDCTWGKTTGGETGAVTNSLGQNSIEWLADRINNHSLTPAWTATINAPQPGSSGLLCFYHRQRKMVGILGGGLWWDRSSSSWKTGLDVEGSSSNNTVAMSWQGGYDSLQACPGKVGDVFNHVNNATSGNTPLRLGTVRRNQAVGMWLSSSGLPESNKKLILKQILSGVETNRGEGLTDAKGYAQTGLPYGLISAGSNYGEYVPANTTVEFEGGNSNDFATKRRKRYHFRSGPVGGGLGICLYRHAHDRACLYHVLANTGLVVWDYLYQPNDPSPNKTQTVIDSSASCSSPIAWIRSGDVHECVYLRGQQPYYAKSTQFVRSWTLTSIPGTAEAIAACHHQGRLVVALYHGNRWYVTVGLQNPSSGAYTFSAEQPILAQNAAKPTASLFVRKDNVIEFAYLNSSNQPRVVRCHSLSTQAQGTWT